MRILHVTESMATGVLDVIARMTTHQARLGHQVEVAYVPHPDGPSNETVRERLIGITNVHVRGTSDLPRLRRIVSLAQLYRSLVDSADWDLVHLHSTFAGVVGRTTRCAHPIVYSPHGYSFLRQDVAPLSARVFRAVERALVRDDQLTLCVSQDERRVATETLGARAVAVPNVLARSDIDRALHRPPAGPPQVINVGRWGPQKAPDRFVRAAETLHEDASFRWIGPGDDDPDGRWSVTGWLKQEDLWTELSNSSVIYFTSRWEGMPVGLMQAQACGIPAVAIDCVGVRDVLIDGITGYVAQDEEEALTILKRVILDREELATLSAGAAEHRYRFADDHYGADILKAYDIALGLKRV